jgi:hypothetical protein
MIGKTELSLCLALAAVTGCTDADPTAPRTLAFGPFPLDAGQELTDTCVSVTLHNEQPIYISSIELQTTTGVHHSNWFWVPDHMYDQGPDGVWNCSERGFNEGIAGLFGGVMFAQSTQATHEVQEFPAGAVIKIPRHAKIAAGLHLLNPGDSPISVPLAITIHPIAEADVTTVLAGAAFQNQSIQIPPHATSRFTVECDLGPRHQALFGRPIDFKFFHALPHYHALGTAMTFEAIRDSDGGADMIWSTASRIGDNLGGKLDPPFDMTGHSRLRFSCTFDNPRDTTVGWGLGDQEMCIMFTFTDSTYTWEAGIATPESPGQGVTANGIIDFTSSTCPVLVSDATH